MLNISMPWLGNQLCARFRLRPNTKMKMAVITAYATIFGTCRIGMIWINCRLLCLFHFLLQLQFSFECICCRLDRHYYANSCGRWCEVKFSYSCSIYKFSWLSYMLWLLCCSRFECAEVSELKRSVGTNNYYKMFHCLLHLPMFWSGTLMSIYQMKLCV